MTNTKCMLFALMTLAFLSSCVQPDIPDVTPDRKRHHGTGVPDTPIVWQYNPDTVSNSCYTMVPVLYGHTVVFSRKNSNVGDALIFLDKNTGRLLNLFEDPQKPEWISGSTYQYRNLCVISDWSRVFLLDLEANRVIRQINLLDYRYEGQPRIGGFGEWAYIPVEVTDNPRQDYGNTWLRWNMLTGEMQEVMSIEDQGSFEAGFESLAFWLRPDGDTIMIFQNRQYDFIHRDRRIDLYAYNMTKGSMEWKLDSLTLTGQTSVFPIIVKNDRLYFQGSNEAFCFSCADGRLIWKRYFPGEGFFVSNAVLAEGRYVLKSETYRMYALDENTGETVWMNPVAGPSSSNLVYHNGYVYYETGQDGLGVLRRIRVNDGKVDWTCFPGNYKYFFQASYGPNGIVIDHEKNLLYANDRVFHLCVKLPE